MRILVTGSGGFIGQAVTGLAVRQGHAVRGLGRTLRDGAGAPTPWTTGLLVETLEAFQPDAIFHAAGGAGVAQSLMEPGVDFAASVGTLQLVLEAVRMWGQRPRVVFPSSAAVYGEPAGMAVAEDAPRAPMSPYGAHKMACEVLLESYARSFGIPSVAMRLFSVFGAAQRRLLVWELARQLLEHRTRVELAGTGVETRDYLHVEDVARVALELMAAPAGLPQVLNVARGVSITTRALAQELAHISGADVPVVCRGEARPGNPSTWAANVSRLAHTVPTFLPGDLRSGLAMTFEAWRQDAASTKGAP